MIRAVVLALLVSACATPRVVHVPKTPYLLWVDARFLPDQRRDIKSAVETWNKALEGFERFDIVSDNFKPESGLTVPGVTIEASPLDPSWAIADTVGFRRAVGGVAKRSDLHVRLFLPKFVNGKIRFDIVVAHELGHVLGLEDNEPDSDLMRGPYGKHQNCIDLGTLRRVAIRHSWPEMPTKTVCF